MLHRLKARHERKSGTRVIFRAKQTEPDFISNVGPCRIVRRARWFHTGDILETKPNQLIEKGSVARSDIQSPVQIGKPRNDFSHFSCVGLARVSSLDATVKGCA